MINEPLFQIAFAICDSQRSALQVRWPEGRAMTNTQTEEIRGGVQVLDLQQTAVADTWPHTTISGEIG